MLNPGGLLRIGGKSAGTIIGGVSQFAAKMGRAVTDLLRRSRRLNPPCVGLWITTVSGLLLWFGARAVRSKLTPQLQLVRSPRRHPRHYDLGNLPAYPREGR